MGITTSLLLLAIGAIVVAVTTYNTVGWILVAVGALRILLSLVFLSGWGGVRGRRGGAPRPPRPPTTQERQRRAGAGPGARAPPRLHSPRGHDDTHAFRGCPGG